MRSLAGKAFQRGGALAASLIDGVVEPVAQLLAEVLQVAKLTRDEERPLVGVISRVVS